MALGAVLLNRVAFSGEAQPKFCAVGATIWPVSTADPIGTVFVIDAAAERGIVENDHCKDLAAPALGPSCSVWGPADVVTEERHRLAVLSPEVCSVALAAAHEQ